ncbi:MAG TPA: hypothetical protein VG370_29075 [Chloroflexota bacterium]|jgi:hypothetical protein|nr:hypothetical protein [Chloroflexota bacterium]
MRRSGLPALRWRGWDYLIGWTSCVRQLEESGKVEGPPYWPGSMK